MQYLQATYKIISTMMEKINGKVKETKVACGCLSRMRVMQCILYYQEWVNRSWTR